MPIKTAADANALVSEFWLSIILRATAGDLGFLFQRLSALARCTEAQANENSCFLAYRPVVKQFFVDVDGKYGPYMRSVGNILRSYSHNLLQLPHDQ